MKTRTASFLALVSFALMAQAQAQSGLTQGRVLDAKPVYKEVRVPTEKEVCWDERVSRHHHRSRTPTLLGGLIGGVVGHQFGDGRGQDAMTVAGALIGASVGRDIEKDRRHRRHGSRTVKHCRIEQTYYRDERLIGYDVSYEYQGQVYHTQTEQDPGEYIDLRVSVEPVRY